MSQQLELYTYCSMTEQDVEEVQMEKGLLVGNIAMWLYHFLAGSEGSSKRLLQCMQFSQVIH